jgi:uncharacterized protein YbgA (DUF1722 family)/uncharacterized protein YbbK (DUF523 family)
VLIGISDCLLGTKCRYDGQHKRSRFVTDVLSRYAKFLPFCPEGAMLGTPRESMFLARSEKGPRAITQKSGIDQTDKLLSFNHEAIARISGQKLCGFIFKAKSPSCGLERVKLYTADHQPTDEVAQGLFAQAITEAFPLLPVEEEGRLEDPWLRENFMMQIFSYQRWLDFEASGPQMRDLVAFHARHKFLLLGKNEVNYRTLGRLVANHDKRDLADLLAEYHPLFLQTIGEKSSLKSTLNQLQHLYGFVKKLVDEAEKTAILESIDHYAQRIIPLIVPLKLIELAARKHQVTYLLDQHYLSPYPQELGLRSDLSSSK